MTQYEQENDLGRGGGEVDDETMDAAWRRSLEDRPNRAPEQERPSEQPEQDVQQDRQDERGDERHQ